MGTRSIITGRWPPMIAAVASLLLALVLLAEGGGGGGGGAEQQQHCVVPPDSGSTLRILHAFGPCSPLHDPAATSSWEDTLLVDMITRDDSRLQYLSSLATARRSFVPIASGRQIIQTPIYVVRARFGTPPQNLLVAVDTSSDAAWVPCTACAGCPVQSSAAFAPARSATYRPVPCGSPACGQVTNPSCSTGGATACAFNLTYGSSSVAADLGRDSLALASEAVPGYTFGCIRRATGSSVPPQGLLGLGRGPLSFLSQSRSLYGGTFSYCLPSFRSLNFSGTLRLGPVGQPVTIKTTPLLSSLRRSSLYYVSLTGIRVGRRLAPIPPSALAFDKATGAGTVFDSGTMFTRLVAPAYLAVRDEFRRRLRAAGPVSSLGGFDTCYRGLKAVPTVTLEFVGMNVSLPAENVMIHSTAGDLSCLAMASAPDNVNSVLNVIANMQQQNHRVLFDVANARVGVAREICTH